MKERINFADKRSVYFLIALVICSYVFLFSAYEMNKQYDRTKEAEVVLVGSYSMLESLFKECETYMYNIDVITRLSEEWQLPPSIVLAVIKLESNFNPDANSGSNFGLMQINEMHIQYFEDKMDIFGIEKNVEIGTSMLGQLYEKNPELNSLFNSYNMGQYGYIAYVEQTGEISRDYSRKAIDIVKQLEQ